MERFEFQFNTATSEPPSGSQVRLDNADPALATKLWARNTTTPGEDVHRLLMALPAGSYLYLQEYDDWANAVGYLLEGDPVDKGDYVELPVSWLGGPGGLPGQKVMLAAFVPADEPEPPEPSPPIPVVAYATVDELAAALRITVTQANQDSLQACLDAAAIEIDDTMDRTEPLDHDDPLANRVNILRGVEWFKANDAAFGVIGVSDTGTLQAPRNTFRRHAAALLPHKQLFGVG